MIHQLLGELERLAGIIKKNKAVNVNSQSMKQQAIELGSAYFSDYRSHIVGVLRDSEDLSVYDEKWQQLIRLAHGNNPKATYEKLLRSLVKKTREVNVIRHSTVASAPAIASSELTYSQAEEILLTTLDKLLPSAAASYRQGLADISCNLTLRHSYRGTAAEFREAFRETLDHLAPDQEVMAQSWYKPEKDQKLPTMKQKVKFVLSSRGKEQDATRCRRKDNRPDGSAGGRHRACDLHHRASLSTHVETTKQEVEQLKRYMDAVLFDLLEIGQ